MRLRTEDEGETSSRKVCTWVPRLKPGESRGRKGSILPKRNSFGQGENLRRQTSRMGKKQKPQGEIKKERHLRGKESTRTRNNGSGERTVVDKRKPARIKVPYIKVRPGGQRPDKESQSQGHGRKGLREPPNLQPKKSSRREWDQVFHSKRTPPISRGGRVNT